jgi:MFS family permease
MGLFSGRGTFRAFRSRNYALYFSGQSVSLIGTWMQRTSVIWVIYTMTHSAFMLGVTVFASQFPSFVLSLYGGILSDRYNRYRIILLTQTISMVQSVVLAGLVLTGHASVWIILALSILLGIVNAFDIPARQPLVNEMIGNKADLPNALALNASMVNIARLAGPALAGIILQRFGAGICFAINAISFIAVLSSLLLMRLPAYVPPVERKRVAAEFSEGFQYVRKTPVIRNIIIMLTFISLLVLSYDTLLPVFAKMIFHGGADTFGYIRSFIGAGAVVGTLFLASVKPGTDLKRILFFATLILGTGLILFSRISVFPVAMLFAALSGFGTVAQNTICNTLIQMNSSQQMRGRAISFFTMAIFGMLPLGSLLVGMLSQHIGAPDTLLIQGIVAIVIATGFSGFLLGRQKIRSVFSSYRNNNNINKSL